MVKDPPADAEDVRDARSIPGSGRSPCRRAWRPTPGFLPGESPGTEEPGGATVHGEGHDNRLQCSCLEDPMDRGAWRGYRPWGRTESVGTEQLTLSLYGHSAFALRGSKCSRSVSTTVFGFNFDLLARRGNLQQEETAALFFSLSSRAPWLAHG